MMMDTTVDNDGTAFICPECNFCGRTLPELMTHLNEVHVEGGYFVFEYLTSIIDHD